MNATLAQQPLPALPPVGIADAFALTLIFILFGVLLGVLLVARTFRRRSRRPPEEAMMDELLQRTPPEPPPSPPLAPPPPSASPQTDGRPPRAPTETREPWERDPDWWTRL